MSVNNQARKNYSPSRSLNLDLTMELSATGLLSDRSFMKMETKFISHLNAKYLIGSGNQQAKIPNSPSGLMKSEKQKDFERILPPFLAENSEKDNAGVNKISKKAIAKEEQDTNTKAKKPKKHHHHHGLKIDIVGSSSKNVEAITSPKKKPAKEAEKPLGLQRSNTMSPTKSSMKPRYSDESPRKKYRVKFNKKDQVFKVENFKDELRKIKLMSDY